MWLWSPEHLTNGPLFFYSEPFLILFVPVGQSARLVPLVLKVYSARVQLRSILWVKDLRSDRADLSSALCTLPPLQVSIFTSGLYLSSLLTGTEDGIRGSVHGTHMHWHFLDVP